MQKTEKENNFNNLIKSPKKSFRNFFIIDIFNIEDSKEPKKLNITEVMTKEWNFSKLVTYACSLTFVY